MVLNLQTPRKRSDIPVAPHIFSWAGAAAGITQAEIMRDAGTWLKALDKTFVLIGKPDTCSQSFPGDAVLGMGILVFEIFDENTDSSNASLATALFTVQKSPEKHG